MARQLRHRSVVLAPPLPRLVPGRSTAGWVVAAGLAVTALLSSYVAYWERRGVAEESRELAKERIELLGSTLRVSMQVLDSLQSLHAAAGRIEPVAFALFARDARRRHPELQALEWAPRLTGTDRERFEQHMRSEGYPSFRLNDMTAEGAVVPAARRETYYPVQLIEPMIGNERALGLDLASDPRRRAALDAARATRLPAATAPLRLAQAQQLDETGFLVLLPLYRDADLEGFVLAVFRVDDLIRLAMQGMNGRGINFAIDDVTETDHRRVYGQALGDRSLPAGSVLAPAAWLLPIDPWRETMQVAGRRWELKFTPQPGFINRNLPWQTAAALFGGLVITALSAAGASLAARRRSEVAQANAALQAEVAQREQAVRDAVAASQSKSNFLANMSHEIRTPMNAVLGYAQWLRRDARLDENQREAVNAIVTAGSHLMNQINEVLDFSKIESGRLELHRVDFDLNSTLADLETMFRPRSEEKRLKLDISRLPPERAWVNGDNVKLQQVLINLLGNAVRFTSVGEVALRCTVEADDAYCFDVIDTGPGVAEDERERIFEAFHQAPATMALGGSGLGLAIARRQAESMGGSLTLATGHGAGSVFSLRTRLAPAAGPPPSPSTDGATAWRLAEGQRLQALVVDDLAVNRDVLARLLREFGAATHDAADAAQALAFLADQAVDVVFLDMRMPGCGGLSALGAIKTSPSRPRVIAYSAAAFEQDRARFLAAGCDGVLSKPIAIDSLIETLASVCGLRFERVQANGDDGSLTREPDYARLRVPAALLERMLAATELHSATVLKACLEELRMLGPEAQLLARHLRQHLRAYDMNAVARLLLRLSEDTPPESHP